MNGQTILILASVMLSTATYAQEATSDSWQRHASVNTRQSVNVELSDSRKSGATSVFSTGYNSQSAGALNRADVQADFSTARANGEWLVFGQEAQTFR